MNRTKDLSDNFIFYFETNKFDDENHLSYYFTEPVKIIRLEEPEKLSEFFHELARLSEIYYIAGFFSYELGYILESAFNEKRRSSFPYALFCAYDNPAIFDHKSGNYIKGVFNKKIEHGNYKISNIEMDTSQEEYFNNINKIHGYIRKGDIYQANYTVKYKFDFMGSTYALYNDLKQKQYAGYNVFARFDDYYLLSLSPELFFRKKGDRIIVRPMKGTWHRGRTLKEDTECRESLAGDEKNRSENVMIVDLLRNDIGKVSKPGSVITTRLYDVEKYNTLFQMTSTIESIQEDNISIYYLIKSIFPSGSITGAPKIRSMQIIGELEKEERKVYTGSIGFFEPGGNAIFNVAIRTLLLKGNKGEMGVGGGIVYDSTPEDEFRECKLKADFLIKNPVPEFSIIETILFNKKYEYMDLHMDRMSSSAEYFDYLFDRDALNGKLLDIQKGFGNAGHKIRVLLDRSGNFTVTSEEIRDNGGILKIAISEKHTESSNIYLYHKTTIRDLYEKELASARKRGFYDVIFLNERDEVAEGSITNIYVKINNKLYTPPVECGLLNGTIRQTLLEKGESRERILSLADLLASEAVYISNSIIGLREAVLGNDPEI